jgi:hypothetical protein
VQGVVVTIRETKEGNFQYDLSRDVSAGARFRKSEPSVRVGDTQVRSPALEGSPDDNSISTEGGMNNLT